MQPCSFHLGVQWSPGAALSNPRHIGIQSPLALFAPAHRIDSLIPAPLYLLELVPGSLKTSYPTNDRGFIVNDEDSHFERVIHYPGGNRCSVNVQGSQKLGLPNQFDWDYLLALLRIADEGGVDPDGKVRDPSYRAILRAAGRSDDAGTNYTAAVKRALARWQAVTVRTQFNIEFGGLVDQVRSGDAYPVVPDGYPERTTRDRGHYVLEYDISSAQRGGDEVTRIDLLRLNPVWLEQPLVGLTAWLDVEQHNSLRSALAKRIYQVLALRMARGARPPFVLSLDDFLAEIAFSNSQKPGAQAKQISAALTSLQAANIVLDHSVKEIGRGAYEISILPGDRLHAAGLFRGVGGEDKAWTRTLLYHLGVHGISIATGRQLLRSHPTQTLAVLRRAYYVQTKKNGIDVDGRPVENWGGWIRKGIEQKWEFTEPGYLQWLDQMSGRALAGPEEKPVLSLKPAASRPQKKAAAEEAAAPAEDAPLPTTEWGRALECFRSQIPGQAFSTWLGNTWQVELTDHAVVVGTPGAFAVDWIRDKYGDELERILGEIVGRKVLLVVQHGEPPPREE